MMKSPLVVMDRRAFAFRGAAVALSTMRPRVAGLPHRVALAPKRAELFYQSKEWRATAARVKRRDGYACVRCGSGQRLIADHIVERKDGGADLDEANLETLCGDCHAKKTAEARKRRARGQGGG
jgi:5-methylcytosine-specific restriction enzyme A